MAARFKHWRAQRLARRLLIAMSILFAAPALGQGGELPRWQRMDYGPFLSTAVGIGGGVAPVHKGIVVRLRTRAGEGTDLHAVFDTDLLAWRCVWRGELALKGIVFDGPHGTFPEIAGEPLFRAGAWPGVATAHGERIGDPREEPFGPIPTSIGRWEGLHLDGRDVVLEYSLADGRHLIRERLWAAGAGADARPVREITVRTEDDRGEGPVVFTGSQATWLPANGSVLIEIGATRPQRTEPGGEHALETALARARPRWGEPISTVGVVGYTGGGGESSQVIVRSAGAEETSVRLPVGEGGAFEVLGAGEVVRAIDSGEARALLAPDAAVGWWPADDGEGAFEKNQITGRHDLRLDGVTWRRGVGTGRSLDFDGTAAAWLDEADIDLGEHDLTVAAWISTRQDGTVFAVAPAEGDWAPDGATLFLRGGKLSFDVGWVGVVSGGPAINDGAWHYVGATWRHRTGQVDLYVDGQRVASGVLQLRNDRDRSAFVARFGWTCDNFPQPTRFSGYIDNPVVLRRAIDAAQLAALAGATGEPLAAAARVRREDGRPLAPGELAVELVGDGPGRHAVARMPPAQADARYQVTSWRGPRSEVVARALEHAAAVDAPPFRLDRLTWPDENRWDSWMRFGAFDFAADDDEAAYISTWSGDVWRVDGLDEALGDLRWTRFATGLNQPFGVVASGEHPLVLGRDQITRLVDVNGDGEADFYQNFSNLGRNSEHFHEPASGLLITARGELLYQKAARHAKLALHAHHGTVVRVAPDGLRQEAVAYGFRAPIGLGRLPDGSLLGSDQEGHWTPANRINLIRPAGAGEPARFYGNSWGATPAGGGRVERAGEEVYEPWADAAPMTPPLCWIPPSVDRSPSSQVYVDHPAWGPLRGSILGLSYGRGEVYLVLREDVEAEDGPALAQGGIVKLGIEAPTGLLAGKIHPRTGDLYLCGLVGWSSNQPDAGGFYRVRPNADAWARALNVPHRMKTRPYGFELTFLHPLDGASVRDAANWSVSAWDYRRTANYGSAIYDLNGRESAQTAWPVSLASLSADGRTVTLVIDGFEPAMQVRVAWEIQDAAGRPLEHEAHLTVHAVR